MKSHIEFGYQIKLIYFSLNNIAKSYTWKQENDILHNVYLTIIV